MAKSTRLETVTRVETVRQLIISGVEASAIVRTVAEKWTVKDRQAWNYVIKARAEIAIITQQARPYLLAEHIAVRRDIRRRAREAHDLRAEIAAAQDEAKLFGLYPSEKVEIFDWRKDAQAAGVDPDSLVAELFSKVPVKDDATDGQS
jgi:hypothetical protein